MNKQLPDEKITLIVGAGVTGLTAAYTLANAGEKCLLLEREATIGGGCRTYVLDDVTFDLGPHVLLLNPDSEADKLLLKLLENEEVISKNLSVAFHVNGKYWRFPPSIRDVLFYPWKYKKQMILVRLRKNKRETTDANSFQSLIEQNTGHSYYNDLFSSFILKKTCITGDKVHRDWFLRTDRDIKNRKENPKKAKLLKHWYYPCKGFEIIPQKLWEKYCHLGGKTILNCGPISFDKTKDRIISAKAGDKTFFVKDIIWTASINELNNLIDARVQPVNFVDTLIICLTYNRKARAPRPFIYTYHPQDDLIFNRIYYPDHIYGEKNPSDREGICLEINCFQGLQNMTDDEIITRAVGDVEKLGFFRKRDLRQQRHFWLKECMPVYELDYEIKLQETFQAVHKFQNLYAVGRKGGYFFCQTPAAVNQGLKVAKHLLQSRSKSGAKD